ncbi:hypothetical protein ACFLU6_00205 [Acidobacteriota bacterium]
MKRLLQPLFLLLLAVTLVTFGCSSSPTPLTSPDTASMESPTQQDQTMAFGQIKAVQQKHTPGLLGISGIVGTATGKANGKYPVLVILAEHEGIHDIPDTLDGADVEVVVTGPIYALGNMEPQGNTYNAIASSPSSQYPRPVPIGISTGSEVVCTSGTIACRVKRGGSVYALSNNHVLAGTNSAQLGSRVLQPGRYDSSCSVISSNVMGNLYDFVPIDFSGGYNLVDAAIALTSTSDLGKSTPPDGYGIPCSETLHPQVDMGVVKYGRATGFTWRAEITSITATVKVAYPEGTATFNDQIMVRSPGAFAQEGDSGSLLVTEKEKRPVGLIFAASSNGTLVMANRIDHVLDALDVTIDGK